MASFISERLGDSFLGELKDEIPTRNDFRYRVEDFGYTVFDTETLKTTMMDKLGFSILNKIDGKQNLKAILEKASKETKTPYFVAAAASLKYLSHMAEIGLVRMSKAIQPSFNGMRSDSPVPSGPNQISWLITNQCNLRCTHCGNTSRAKLENELSIKECFDFIDQCAKRKVFILNISGGEPFLRKEWFKILSYAREKGIEVGITTNGTLLTEEIVKKIKALSTFNVHVSLDGIGKVHDEFRNKSGVFRSVLKSVRLLKKHRIPFGITTSITKRNFADLDNVRDFIKENRINSWNLYYALPVGCLKKAESISVEEFYMFAQKVAEYKEMLKDITHISVGDSLGYYGSLHIRDAPWSGCGAGICGCSIDAEGNVKGCPIQDEKFIEGNIRKRSLKDIWSDKKSFVYNRKPIKLSKHCKTCKYGKTCKGGCKSSMHAQGTEFMYNDYCIYNIERSKR